MLRAWRNEGADIEVKSAGKNVVLSTGKVGSRSVLPNGGGGSRTVRAKQFITGLVEKEWGSGGLPGWGRLYASLDCLGEGYSLLDQ